jgi:hypothetical protein
MMMAPEHQQRHQSRDPAQMCALDLIALVMLAITAAGLLANVGSAQTPTLECSELSDMPDDGTFVPRQGAFVRK